MINQQTVQTTSINKTPLYVRPAQAAPYGRRIPTGTGAVQVRYAELESDTAGENITVKNAIVRILLTPGLVFTSFTAWDYNPYYSIALAPVVFYLIFTVFTLYCPLTALWYDIKARPAVINTADTVNKIN